MMLPLPVQNIHSWYAQHEDTRSVVAEQEEALDNYGYRGEAHMLIAPRRIQNSA